MREETSRAVNQKPIRIQFHSLQLGTSLARPVPTLRYATLCHSSSFHNSNHKFPSFASTDSRSTKRANPDQTGPSRKCKRKCTTNQASTHTTTHASTAINPTQPLGHFAANQSSSLARLLAHCNSQIDGRDGRQVDHHYNNNNNNSNSNDKKPRAKETICRPSDRPTAMQQTD
ncbi:hypothetical protein BKA80DRAFT_36227 [Phyllosticta citrichinensis]